MADNKVIKRISLLKSHWNRLCGQYFPLLPDDSIWRYSRPVGRDDPDQGWKIHVSATVLTACNVVTSIGQLLKDANVLLKAPVSLDELIKINSGLWYGYWQVGKFITVYPRNDAEFSSLCEKLYLLTRPYSSAPAVPFDRRAYSDGCIYYRYGAFRASKTNNKNGSIEQAIVSPNGTTVSDCREIAAPVWASDPFQKKTSTSDTSVAAYFPDQYHVFSALTQRGKGGVYKAIDTSSASARLCIIKEGRKNGEAVWDGRDGRWRILNEKNVLSALAANGVGVPRVYDSFESGGNFYLVLEKIEGLTLQEVITSRKRRLPILRALTIGIQVAKLIAKIHSAGWVWRDCKPSNLFIDHNSLLRPIDFEGACPINKPDPFPWSTPLYAPPEVFYINRSSTFGFDFAEDLFALGTCLFYLFEGNLPEIRRRPPPNGLYQSKSISNKFPAAGDLPPQGAVWGNNGARLKFRRREIPVTLKGLISQLLNADPARRPDAKVVHDALGSIQRHLSQKMQKSFVIAERIEERLNL